VTDSAPTNLTPSGYWGGYTPTTPYQSTEQRQRQADFQAADHAKAISAKFEEVRVLVDRLLTDLEALPTADEVGNITGAAVHEALAFAIPFKQAINAAKDATVAIRNEVIYIAQAVHDTLTDLSNADANAHAILTNTNTHTQELIQQRATSTTSREDFSATKHDYSASSGEADGSAVRPA